MKVYEVRANTEPSPKRHRPSKGSGIHTIINNKTVYILYVRNIVRYIYSQLA